MQGENVARVIMLQNTKTGITKKGLYGFSWTTLFFGPAPALLRGDVVTALCLSLGGFLTFGIFTIIWAFVYNKYYTQNLIADGYALIGDPGNVNMAMSALGVYPTNSNHIIVQPQNMPPQQQGYR